MNCGDCGRKMIMISCNYGIIVYCPNCCPDGDKIFMRKRNDNKLEEALGHKPKEEVK